MPAGIAYMTEPTLEFIAKQLEKVLTEQRALRDDMRVLTAMTLRVDSTMLSIQAELHEIHRWATGANDRLRKLEDTTP
jgi:hypothetical protein